MFTTFTLIVILFGDSYVVDHNADQVTCHNKALTLAAHINKRGWSQSAQIYCEPDDKGNVQVRF